MNGYVGTLPGFLSADNSGGASYSVEIDVPPGIAGMAPRLSLGYSSLAGNGPLGVGWSLAGLSVIERCASTIAQDAFLGGITFSDTDRLMLDQSRMVAPSGSAYFGSDTVFETEIQSWHSIVPIYSGTPGRHGPDAFEVRHRDGRIFRYGSTPDAQGVVSQTNPSIRAWYLSSITDTCGNVILFSYVDAGTGWQRLPSAIAYTANGSVAARRSVRFNYELRTDILDGYVAGYEVSTDRRLQTIVSYVDEKVVSTYSLVYEYGLSTGRSRLVSITRADGSDIPLPPTSFVWQEATPNFGAPSRLDTSEIQWGGSFLPADIDGNGRVDFVNAYEGSAGELCLTLYLANADGSFASPIQVAPSGLLFGGQIVTLDANGDGRMELVYAANNNGMLGLTLFTAAFLEGAWTLVPGPVNQAGPTDLAWGGTLVAADVDGDGLADLVLMTETSSGLLRLQTLFSNGTSFALCPTDTTVSTMASGGQLLAFDANADGMDDLVYATQDGSSWNFTLYRSTGRNGFVETLNVLDGIVPLGGQLIPIDVNADGNVDIIHIGADPDKQTMVARVLVNNGRRFSAGPAADTGLPYGGIVLPASLTGSATPELLMLTHDAGNNAVLSAFRTSAAGLTALGGVAQPPSGTKAGGNGMPLDLRGTGFSDLVYAVNADGVQGAIVMPALGPYPDLMICATNGIGAKFTAGYAPLTDPSVYSAADTIDGVMEPRALLHSAISGASYGLGITPQPASTGSRQVLQRTPIPKYVLSSSSKSDGIGGAWSTNYRYEGALIDHSGRGWLGFGALETDDLDAGTTTRKVLHQMFPLTQMLKASTMTRTADAALMTDAEYGYEVPQTGSSYQVLCVSSSTLSYNFGTAGDAADTEVVTRAIAFDICLQSIG